MLKTSQKFNSHDILPKLQINSMKTRVNKAADIYKDNLRMYQRLMMTKSTIPTVEELKVINLENKKLKQRISQYDVTIENNLNIGDSSSGLNSKATLKSFDKSSVVNSRQKASSQMKHQSSINEMTITSDIKMPSLESASIADGGYGKIPKKANHKIKSYKESVKNPSMKSDYLKSDPLF